MGKAALALAFIVLLPACMGDDSGATLVPRAPGLTCDGPPLRGATGLPGDFPQPAGATYVKTEQRGPTRVVNAYFAGSLGDAYEAYREALDSAGYTVLFDEVEATDSEVVYEHTKSRSTGQVALKAGCNEDDRVSVRITNRPG